MPKSSRDGSFVAALWEYPRLCIAFFGIQFLTEEGQRLYEEAGIAEEMEQSLATAEGLLLNRPLSSPEGPLLLQYWCTPEDLDRYARRMPHGRWWKWLMAHLGEGLGFYHEIYGVRSAEAIFERGTTPAGPALFTSNHIVTGGEGRSRERLRRFAEAVAAIGDEPATS